MCQSISVFHFSLPAQEISSSTDNTISVHSSLCAGPISVNPVTCYQMLFKSASGGKNNNNREKPTFLFPELKQQQEPLGLLLTREQTWDNRTIKQYTFCFFDPFWVMARVDSHVIHTINLGGKATIHAKHSVLLH